MKHIPNTFTSLNLTSGFLAIIFILNGNIMTASWCILAAMIFDFLDGFAARALKAFSELGRELDSLADLVSFGVAPGLIIFKLLTSAAHSTSPYSFSLAEATSYLFIIASAIMPVCSALRLAKFNLDTTQSTNFKGLPTPANALAVVTLVVAQHYSDSQVLSALTGSQLFVILLSVSLSLMMVTRVKLLSLKFKDLKLKGNEGRYGVILICAVIISIFGISVIPVIIPVYIIVSVIYFLF
jgi:CDP-diacylglycerol---serine O-phosphatidyltransferase